MQNKHHQEEHADTQSDVEAIAHIHGAIIETDLLIENFAAMRAMIVHFGKALPERVFVHEKVALVAFGAFIVKNRIEFGSFQHSSIRLL